MQYTFSVIARVKTKVPGELNSFARATSLLQKLITRPPFTTVVGAVGQRTQSIPLDLDASFSRFSSSVHKRHLLGLSNEILADKDVRGLDSRRSLRSSEE